MPRLTENIGNNQFHYDQAQKSQLRIADLIEGTTNDLEIGEKTVFREMKNGELVEFKGLKKFICERNQKQSIYIFDNHNHALKCRYDEYKSGNIPFGFNLIHIDQHTDMNKSEFDFDLGNPNFDVYNVGNFIQPAIKMGLINKVEQINTEYKLLNFQTDESNLVLDIDLDFRAPEMSIEKYDETLDMAKKLITKSKVVTIATSPYFLDQNLAIKICKEIL